MDDKELSLSAATADEEGSETPMPRTATGRVDVLQLVFWGSLVSSIAAAVIALIWPQATGAAGPVLLTFMGSGLLVFLLWSVRGAGRVLGLFPERGSAARATQAGAPKFPWIEALDEAVLITEQGGAPVAANAAYHDLSRLALIVAPAETGPVTADRLFGSNPGLAAPVYRLSRSAKAGQGRREVLPPVPLGPEQVPAQFEVSVSPLPRARVLWRIRRIAGKAEATGAADLKSLYVEEAPLGFFAARPDGTITYANAWLREMLGLPESAKNIRIDDIMRPEFVKLLSRDRKSGAPGRADIMLRGRDGVETAVQAITTWSGKGAEATGRTILLASTSALGKMDDRPDFGATVRPPRADSDPMFDDAPFGVMRLDGDSVEGAILLDVNRDMMALAEGAAQPGGRFFDMFDPEDGDEALRQKLLSAINKPVPLTLKGDPAKHVNVSVTLDPRGRPAMAYIMDLTEQRQLEARLAHGEKMQAIGQLAGGVAHDFNNALQGIIANHSLLAQRHPAGDPSHANLQSIFQFAARGTTLVKMLLAYARQQTFKREVFHMTDFMSEFSVMLRQLLDERIELDIKHGRDVPYIKADKSQLENVLFNLANNARDAMIGRKGNKPNGRAQPKLTIRTARATEADAHAKGFSFVEDGEYMLIEVEDTGSGMTKDVMEKIFQPFFTTKAQGEGTGLGLATVYGIVKQSGGYICTTSTVGQGTTFHVYLPALRADEVPQPDTLIDAINKPHRPVDASGRGRILFVEDEDGVRIPIAMILRSRGYEVDEAGDGDDALDMLKAKPGGYDLIISDVIMPGRDGPTLIRDAKEFIKDARVVFISGYAEPDVAAALDKDQEVSFLPKPFTAKQLAERVKQEIGMPAEKEAAA